LTSYYFSMQYSRIAMDKLRMLILDWRRLKMSLRDEIWRW